MGYVLISIYHIINKTMYQDGITCHLLIHANGSFCQRCDASSCNTNGSAETKTSALLIVISFPPLLFLLFDMTGDTDEYNDPDQVQQAHNIPEHWKWYSLASLLDQHMFRG